MRGRPAVVVLALAALQLVALLVRGGLGDRNDTWVLLVGAGATAVLGAVVARSWRPDARPTLALVLAMVPVLLISLHAGIGLALQRPEVGAPLWRLTDLLGQRLLSVELGSRVSSVLLACVAVGTTLTGSTPPWQERGLLAAYALGVAAHVWAPDLGAIWLVPLAPLVLSSRPAVGMAMASAIVIWGCADRAELWSSTLQALDPSGPASRGPRLLPLALDTRPVHLPLVIAALPSLLPAARLLWALGARRSRPGGWRRTGVVLAATLLTSGALVLALGSPGRAIREVAADGVEPAPELEIEHGHPLQGGEGLASAPCTWVVRRGEPIALAGELGCAAVTLVGLGPSFRYHHRLAGLGPAFDLPDVAMVSTLEIELSSTTLSHRIRHRIDVETEPRLGVRIDGSPPFAVGLSRTIPLAVDPSMPAHRALAWADELAVFRVRIELSLAENP